jgi:hypothetical protein
MMGQTIMITFGRESRDQVSNFSSDGPGRLRVGNFT